MQKKTGSKLYLTWVKRRSTTRPPSFPRFVVIASTWEVRQHLLKVTNEIQTTSVKCSTRHRTQIPHGEEGKNEKNVESRKYSLTTSIK